MLLKLAQMTSMVYQPYRQENNSPFTGGVMKLESKSRKGILTMYQVHCVSLQDWKHSTASQTQCESGIQALIRINTSH